MRTYIASSLLLLFTTAALGCVQDNSDSPIVILYNQQPGADCTITSSDSGAAIVRGIIDSQSPVGYLFTPVVKNYAQTSMFIDVDQRTAYLEGAVIKVELDGEELANYTTLFGAVVEPDEGTTGLLFELIPQPLVQDVAGRLGPDARATIQTTVRLFGRLGGGAIETQDFSYAIDVCNGCLINDLGTCSLLNGDVSNLGGNCNPLQDAAAVDCCTENNVLVCPATTMNAP